MRTLPLILGSPTHNLPNKQYNLIYDRDHWAQRPSNQDFSTALEGNVVSTTPEIDQEKLHDIRTENTVTAKS